MMKVPSADLQLPRKSIRKIKSNKMLAIDQLAYRQLEQNLKKDIVEYVDEARTDLQNMEPDKANKILKTMERNLNKYMSYNPNVSILNLPKNKIVKLQVNNCPDQQDIFNKKLMNKLFIEQQKQRVKTANRRCNKQKGVLVNKLLSAKRLSTEPNMRELAKGMGKQKKSSMFVATRTRLSYTAKNKKINKLLV